jgi:hypothetical protein
MSMLTPNAQNHGALSPLASRLVHVDEPPWEPTRLPGIDTKTLVFDKDTSMMTVLMKMDPEQCYRITSTRLSSKRGTRRPAGRHRRPRCGTRSACRRVHLASQRQPARRLDVVVRLPSAEYWHCLVHARSARKLATSSASKPIWASSPGSANRSRLRTQKNKRPLSIRS